MRHLINLIIIISIGLTNIVPNVKCDDKYRIGVGIGDITGPAAEINMMGYAKPGQDTHGIHMRLYSRAVIIEDMSGHRICYVSADIAMMSQILKLEVLKILEKNYEGVYTINNVMLSTTHTHSGPGGFLQYILYIISSQGFIDHNFQAIRDGIVRSIDRAHHNLTDGYVYVNVGQLLDASANRSPTAYDNNSPAERNQYEYNTDKNMTVLKLTDLMDEPLGAVNWFAVHATSMNNTNKLISGDNKGYASQLMEQDFNGGTLHGKGPFVALFPQSNEGDVSPNIRGPYCLDSGLPCDTAHSTCNGKNELCVASGPGRDMFESTRIIGYRQFARAKQLFQNASRKLSGTIGYIHQTVDMSNVVVELAQPTVNNNKTSVRTCAPAMGYSFAAGTTDGPGAFDFFQGDTSPNPFWNLLRNLIKTPSKQITDCQKPKPILFATGEMSFPYQWQPSILPTQIFKLGDSLLVVAVPAEFTTMSGRRLRQAVKEEYDKHSNSDVQVVIAGLANAYASYVATYEEYQVQRYEGASTLYGPHTLDAYIQQYRQLARHLAKGETIDPGPAELNLLSKQISLKPGVIYDGTPSGKRFGSLVRDAQDQYSPGTTVRVTFVAANPRNDVKAESSFLTVERWDPSKPPGNWLLIATDANWETKFYWRRTNTFFGESEVDIVWDIPADVLPGQYRIRHFGNSKNLMQTIKSYIGTSKTFEVKPMEKM